MSQTCALVHNNRNKPIKRNINGVLLLNKPSGITSNRALQIVKRLFCATKSGHTGTLDPMATGLLPICFGEATKFSSMLLNADKVYHASLILGYVSSTGDAEGDISATTNSASNLGKLSCVDIERKLQHFIGKIQQLPPMYSALKYHGKPLYSYARKGIDIKRQPREVIIYDLQVESLVGSELQVTIKCGSGTYIRTLSEDIGKALGYGGAYLTKLCRSGIRRFDLSRAYTLESLENKSMTEREECLYSTDCLVEDLQIINLDSQSASSILQGRKLSGFPAAYKMPAGEKIRLYDYDRRFLGLGEISSDGIIIPKRLMATS